MPLDKLTFVCFKWTPAPHYRSVFGPNTVNVLRSMLSRHYHGAHELVCVTDNPKGISSEVRIIPLWDTHSKLPSPYGIGNPSCYRRLKMFSNEAIEMFGPRFVAIDLDVVICGRLDDLFDNDHDIKLYGDTARNTPYNGSLIQHKAGTRPKLWDDFDPNKSPKLGTALGYIGSDQAWIGACLGPNEPKFTKRDGVYSYRNEIRPAGGKLPPGAKIVVLHGHYDPWAPQMAYRHPWIREHYR